MRRLERGASYIPLIIVLVIMVIAIAWAYIMTDKADQLEADLREARAAQEDIGTRRTRTVVYLQQVGDKLGFPPTEVPADMAETVGDDYMQFGVDLNRLTAWLQERLDAMRNEYVITVPQGVYAFPDEGGIDRVEGDQLEVRYVEPGRIPREVTVQALYGLMDSGVKRMLNDIKGLMAELKQQKDLLTAATASHAEAIAEKDRTIASLQEQYNNLQTSAAQRDRDQSDEINRLQSSVRAAEVALQEAERVSREEINRRDNTILGLQSDVARLMERKWEREQPIGPDGEVLAVTDSQGIAIINRGKADHLKPGTSFTIYNFGKGSVKIDKAQATVIEVGDSTAKVRITTLLNPANPVVTGDQIESVAYNPDEPVNVYLLGRFRKYGKTDAEQRLRSLGIEISESVTIDTDYVVMGSPEREEDDLRATEAYRRAQELGIRIITEEQLAMFTRY